jgi:uncharacterized protein YfaS (alpha-2-macroglobulin family)
MVEQRSVWGRAVGLSRRAAAGAVIAAVGGLVACGGGDAPTAPDPALDPATSAGESVVEAAAAPLVANIRAVGPADRSPAEVVVQLGRPVFPSNLVGRPAPGATRWSMEPEVAGELRITDVDELTFVPALAFRPGTSHRFTLEAVGADPDTAEEVPTSDQVHEFEVPELALLRLSTRSFDSVGMRAELELVFTADVDLAEVKKRARFTLDGKTIRPDRFQQGSSQDIVRVTFLGRSVAKDGEVVAKLQAGVPWLRDASVQASAGEAKVQLKAGKPIELEALLVKEGTNGFYLDVVCNDPSAGGERWYWDRDSYEGWWVSTRCMPDMADLSKIHLSPEVASLSIGESPSGFRIFGDFEQRRYEVQLDAGLKTVDGGVLRETWEGAVRVPKRTPRVSFVNKGRYLPRSAWRELPIEHVNLNMVELEVRHVPPENLVFWLTGDESASARTSNIIARKELWVQGEEDQLAKSWVDVKDLVPDAGRGVYEITVKEQDGSARDAARLVLTDLQLVAKMDRPAPGEPWGEAVHAWARDVHSGAAVNNVELELVRPSGKALARCTTSGDGGCRMALPEDPLDPTAPVAIIGRKGADLTVLDFSELRLDPEGDVSGEAWTAATDAPYRASVYTDRGVYRPGDVAHVSAVVRDAAFHAPESGLRTTLRLFDPHGTELRKKVVEADANGLLTVALPFADFATTGRYRARLEVAERTVGETSFNVEEFVPERMAVEAEVVGSDHRFTDPVPVEVGARWLFGGSAEGSKIEVDCRIEPASFTPEGRKGWSFGPAFVDQRAPRPLSLGQVGGVIGAEGSARVSCPAADRSGTDFGAAAVIAEVSVFEGDSGRTTRASARAAVHPAPIYLGLRPSTDAAKSGVPLTVDGVVVDPKGRKASADAVQITVFRMDEEYGWWWDEDSGDTSYQRLLRRSQAETLTVPVADGAFAWKWTPPASAAGWLVAFEADGARSEVYLEGEGRRYWWSPSESHVDQTPRPSRPKPLELVAPARAKVGETVTVKTTAPFGGHVLWTVETDELERHVWQQVDAGPLEWSFPVESFDPDVYVTAFLIKDPHLESAEAFLPDRASGVQGIRIEPSAYTRAVKLEVPSEVRPWSPLEITLDVGALDAPATATVAVVDQGILSLTDFESPDPNAAIFAKRRLDVDTYETIGWTVLSEPRGPSSRTGGDASGGSGRVQMVKPVALWQGPVEIPTSGKATVSVDVPGYRGELRVMAVVAERTRTGHADATVTVKDPIVVQTTLPRFLVRGDTAEIPVFVSNVSGKDRDVTVALEVEAFDPLEGIRPSLVDLKQSVRIVGGKTGQISLADGKSGTVAFRVKADTAPGAVRFRVVATSGGLRSYEELELPIAPDLPEDRRTERAKLTGDVDLAAMLGDDGWLEGGDTTTFWVTANPYAPALTQLEHVVRYPYGCIEQTTSSTRPLLYVRDLVESIDKSLVASGSVDDMVAAGIERVFSMQTPSGGFGYWPGSSSPNAWGTAYALHMLLDAKEAGHEVPEEPLADAVSWLERRVDGRSGSVDGTTAYQHYVLARAGKARPAEAQRLLEQLDKEQGKKKRSDWRGRYLEADYLLMAAVHLGGDHRHEARLRRLDTSAVVRRRENSWSFYSELRRRTMALAVHQDLFGVTEEAEPAAQQVAERLAEQAGRYYTTQELAWGMTALGKRVQLGSQSLPEVELKAGGTVLAPSAEGKRGDRSWTIRGATSVAKLKLDVAGTPPDGAWLVVTTAGARAKDDLPVGGDGLKVSRTWLTAQGKPVNFAEHALGEPVYVRIDLTNTGRSRVQNVALVDRIPAGWEIENPRLGRGALPDWARSASTWSKDHMNLRDDRVEVFGTVGGSRTVSLFYIVRAVTSGTFHVPDVTAEAMYDPSTWARQTGPDITVKGPWADAFL